MVRLHAERKSKITVSQMFSKDLTQRRNEALKKRKVILQESPELNSIKKLKDSKQLPISLSVCSAGILQTSIHFTF